MALLLRAMAKKKQRRLFLVMALLLRGMAEKNRSRMLD
jgi:hypothetical protein